MTSPLLPQRSRGQPHAHRTMLAKLDRGEHRHTIELRGIPPRPNTTPRRSTLDTSSRGISSHNLGRSLGGRSDHERGLDRIVRGVIDVSAELDELADVVVRDPVDSQAGRWGLLVEELSLLV
jgi:hypothetical protein